MVHRILVVEDEPHIRDLLVEFLTACLGWFIASWWSRMNRISAISLSNSSPPVDTASNQPGMGAKPSRCLRSVALPLS